MKAGDSVRFVHSNYYDPAAGVMSQGFDEVTPLGDSQYRILGVS